MGRPLPPTVQPVTCPSGQFCYQSTRLVQVGGPLPASGAREYRLAAIETGVKDLAQLSLPAFRVIAAGALVAAFDADQRGLAAFRALCQARRSRSLVGDQTTAGGGHPLVADCRAPPRRRQEADLDHVTLDDIADRGQQRGHVSAPHPGAAARIEDRLHLLDDK